MDLAGIMAGSKGDEEARLRAGSKGDEEEVQVVVAAVDKVDALACSIESITSQLQEAVLTSPVPAPPSAPNEESPARASARIAAFFVAELLFSEFGAALFD